MSDGLVTYEVAIPYVDYHEPEELKLGVYEYHGRFYKLEDVVRMHYDDTLWVSYTPLWTDPRYTGMRTSLRTLGDFVENFTWRGVGYDGAEVDSSREPCDGASEGA